MGGRGLTIRAALSSTKSSAVSSSSVTGSLPFSAMYASISRFSKTLPASVSSSHPARLLGNLPLFLEATGI